MAARPWCPITFPLFHSHGHRHRPARSRCWRPAVPLAASRSRLPYAQAYALARRLAAKARTPYAFVMSVRSYLSRARLLLHAEPAPAPVPPRELPVHRQDGYCQQFSGAMALLLRMGGIPARVAAGFTPGTYDKDSGRWIVTDIDAHAWVEAWFPHLRVGALRPHADDGPGARRAAPSRRSSRALPGGRSTARCRQGRRGARSAAWRPPGTVDHRVPAAGCQPVVADRARPSRARAAVPAAARRVCAARSRPHRPARRARARAGADRAPAAATGSRSSRWNAGCTARPTPRPTSGRCACRATAPARAAQRGAAAGAAPRARRGLGFIGACAPCGRCRRLGVSSAVVTSLGCVAVEDVYDLFQRGTALLEAGHHHQAAIPLARARDLAPDKTSVREALGRALFHIQRYEQAAEEFRGGDRTGAHQRLRPVLPGPLPAAARPPRRGPQAARARRLPAARAGATTASTGTARGPRADRQSGG